MKLRTPLLIVCVLSLPFFTGCGEEDESASLEGEQSEPPDSAPISTVSEPAETTLPAPIPTVSEPGETTVPEPVSTVSEPGETTVPAPMSTDSAPGQTTGISGEAAEPEPTDELTGELAALEANVAALESKMLDKSQQARAELAENLESLQGERDRLQEEAEELQAVGIGAMQAFMKGLNDKLNGLERQIGPDEEAD